jgi:AraC-like DNA-binding protein
MIHSAVADYLKAHAEAKIEQIANELHLSTRTLQRQLQDWIVHLSEYLSQSA